VAQSARASEIYGQWTQLGEKNSTTTTDASFEPKVGESVKRSPYATSMNTMFIAPTRFTCKKTQTDTRNHQRNNEFIFILSKILV
jgi:hypothetical protein